MQIETRTIIRCLFKVHRPSYKLYLLPEKGSNSEGSLVNCLQYDLIVSTNLLLL